MSNRRVSVTVDADVSPFVRGLTTAGVAAKTFAHELESADGRMANLVQFGLALAPALVPIGAAAVPAIAGLTAQLGFAVAGAGAAVIAFQGVGDALKALNDYRIDPTAEHLQKLNDTMNALGPAGRDFVFFLQGLRPQLQDLQDIAQAGLFPGLIDGMQEALKMKPEIENLLARVSQTSGEIAGRAGADFNSDEWHRFIAFLDKEAAPTLSAMATTLGNVIHGFANMMMAFDPLADDFTNGMVHYSQAFEDWSAGLAESKSFQEFVDYVQTNGPEARDTLGALADALISLVQAAAPVGSAVLPIIEDLANGLSAIADSSVGPILIGTAAAVGTLGRAMALLKVVGLRGDSTGFLSKMFAVDKITAGRKAIDGVTAATNELRIAQDRMHQAALASRDAQFALIPTADKRAALSAFTTENRKVAAASEQVAVAEREAAAARRAGYAQIGKNAAAIGGLAIATSGLADSTGLTNTASLAMMGTLGGPYGAAIGGAIGMIMDFAESNQTAEDSINALNGALQTGSRDAIKAQKEALQDYLSTQMEIGQQASGTFALIDPRNYIDDPLFGINSLKAAYNDLTGENDKVEAAINRANHALQGQPGLMDIITRGGWSLAQMHANLNQKIDQTSASYADETASIEDNIKAMRDRREEAARALNAELNYKASLLDARDALKENGNTVNESTRAGQANLRALYSMATAWNDQSDAAKNAKGSLKAAQNEFVQTAVNMGMAEGKARDLAKRLFEIPSKVMTRAEFNSSDADKKIAGLKAQLASIDKDLYIRLHVQAPNLSGYGPQIDSAEGNFLRYGDQANRHQPELYRGRVTRVWGEPETQGEAYIPLADDYRRPRAKAIAEQTVAHMDGHVVWFAEGGTTEDKKKHKKPPAPAPASPWYTNPQDKNRLLLSEVNSAFHEFAITLKSDTAEVRSELHDWAQAIREAGGVITPEFLRLKAHMLDLAKAVDLERARVQKTSEALKQLTEDAKSFGEQVGSNFMSDLFGTHDGPPTQTTQKKWDEEKQQWVDETVDVSSLPIEQQQQIFADWQASLATDLGSTLLNDAARADQMTAVLAQLASMGLDGPLYQQLAASGDIDTALSLANLSEKDLHKYEKWYDKRGASVGSLESYAISQVMTPLLRAQEKELKEQSRHLSAMENALVRAGIKFSKEGEHGVEAAVEKGVRGGLHKPGATTKQHRNRG